MGQVSISLMDKTYRFVCGDGEEARIQALAGYVQSKLDGLSQDLGRPAGDRLLVMAALMLADELFEARAATSAVTHLPPGQPTSRKTNAA